MSSGAEMLLKAAISAFVPKETVEEISVTIQGMLKDGTLHGLGSLVADIQEIKRSQARIEFGLARIYAGLSVQQQLHAGRKENGLPRSSADSGLDNTMAGNDRPQLVARPGNGGDAGGEPDGVRGGNDSETVYDIRGLAGHEYPGGGIGKEAAE